MKNTVILLLVVMLLANCTTPTTPVEPLSPSELLIQQFQVANDSIATFHFYNSDEEIENPLPDSLLGKVLSEKTIETIEYGTGDAKHQVNQQFSLDGNHTAYIITGRESWYRNQSLLTYNTETKNFENAKILSQFYGGDGGQIVTESWYYTESGKKYLYQIESSHAIIPSTDSDKMEKMLDEHSQLYIWNGNAFEKTIQQDSLALAERFQLKWEW